MNAVAYFIPAILVLIVALGGAIALKLHRPLIRSYALVGIVLAFLVPPSSLANLHTLETELTGTDLTGHTRRFRWKSILRGNA
jgi:hypothetical protein